MHYLFKLLPLLSVLASGCSPATPSAFAAADGTGGTDFVLTSNLKPGAAIPADYYGNQFGCTAAGLSPQLEWKNPPAGTRSFAVTLFDETAPTGSGFWHYVLIDVSADVRGIELGALAKGKIPVGAVETMTDAGKPGYFGPCPPVGRKHRYIWTVHALKVDKLVVPAGSTPGFVSFNLWANRLGQASFAVTAGPR
jgi:Raf kinase inhibitor-like YbhB/YbcL family protein